MLITFILLSSPPLPPFLMASHLTYDAWNDHGLAHTDLLLNRLPNTIMTSSLNLSVCRMDTEIDDINTHWHLYPSCIPQPWHRLCLGMKKWCVILAINTVSRSVSLMIGIQSVGSSCWPIHWTFRMKWLGYRVDNHLFTNNDKSKVVS